MVALGGCVNSELTVVLRSIIKGEVYAVPQLVLSTFEINVMIWYWLLLIYSHHGFNRGYHSPALLHRWRVLARNKMIRANSRILIFIIVGRLTLNILSFVGRDTRDR